MGVEVGCRGGGQDEVSRWGSRGLEERVEKEIGEGVEGLTEEGVGKGSGKGGRRGGE